MTSRPQSHEIWLQVADVISRRGTCARRRVGCVLVDDSGQVLSTGYNGVAPGRPHCTDERCPGAGLRSGTGLDLCEAIHAEQNALIACPDFRKVHRIYVTCSPCVSCTKMLMRTPARQIFFMTTYAHDAQARELWERDGRHWGHYRSPLVAAMALVASDGVIPADRLAAHANAEDVILSSFVREG